VYAIVLVGIPNDPVTGQFVFPQVIHLALLVAIANDPAICQFVFPPVINWHS
jgi:hypothetical protein